jgi:hypothetical protein
MTQRSFSLITAVLFFLIALLHAVRLLRGWQVTIEGAVVPIWISWMGLPQWSPQNRPMRVTSKPANGRGRGLSCFTLQLPVQASLILYANSADRI